ncbi:MAG: class I SAM-dependent methyltransferase [Sulfitobacter sp.]|nr:class I SAM-dependent methyltransferase [Sulfitobacter sp.]
MSDTALQDIYRCCDCEADLAALDRCDDCGRVFVTEDGCPSAFPKVEKHRLFSVAPGQTNPGTIPVDQVYRYPARSGQRGTALYHLDIAHQDLLETMPSDSLVLEIGCGGGQMREWARGRGLRYLGTDVARTRVHDWLQKYGGADLYCDAHDLPFRDGSVDVIYAAAVWEHLAFPQLAAQEVARVLKPGGHFLGSSSFLEPWHDESYYHNTPNGVYMTLTLSDLEPSYIWPETDWPGFRAILRMGNKATNALAFLGGVMNAIYLAPKKLQHWLRTRAWPDQAALFQPRAEVAGAIAWIARKPLANEKDMGEAAHA